MEKPLYKAGDEIYWTESLEKTIYKIIAVKKYGYDIIDTKDGDIYKNHPFVHTHGKTIKLSKLEKAMK